MNCSLDQILHPSTTSGLQVLLAVCRSTCAYAFVGYAFMGFCYDYEARQLILREATSSGLDHIISCLTNVAKPAKKNQLMLVICKSQKELLISADKY